MLKELLHDFFGVLLGTIIWTLIIGIVIGGLFIWSVAYYFPCGLEALLPNIACAC